MNQVVEDRPIIVDMIWPLEPWCGNDLGKLERFRSAGYTALSLTVAGDDHNAGEALARVAAARRRIFEDDRLVFLETTASIRHAYAQNKLAVGIHFEGTRCFERNLDLVEAFHALGIRHTLLAFNASNSAGGGCAEEEDGGLTRFGRRLIGEMNRVGMLLDLSHVGRRTSLEALEACNAPAVFSHSNVGALAPSFRNLDDEQIRACAATGGLIGISGSSGYLGDLETRTETIVRHMDHIAELVGPGHVGLGLDIVFDSEALNRWVRSRSDEWPVAKDPSWPGFRYARPEQVREIAAALRALGWPEADVEGVLGTNWLRVCREAWGEKA